MVGKLLTAFDLKADERIIGKLIIEVVILLSARSQAYGGEIPRAAATRVHGVDQGGLHPDLDFRAVGRKRFYCDSAACNQDRQQQPSKQPLGQN